MKRLKAALAKAVKRLKAREAESGLAESKKKRLNKEIKGLREKLDSFLLGHREALHQLEKADTPKRREELRSVIARQERQIEEIIRKIDHKVRKRKGWREKGRRARKRAAWWLRRKTTVRKKLKAARKKWEETHDSPAFETWQLNGCPGNITDDLKPVIAFQVVVCGQYITATTNGGHTSTSLHYPWNNSDNLGHACDTGDTNVPDMEEAARDTRDHFGKSYFKELFSPCGWWLKYGTEYSGHFPDHGDHGHYGVD